MAELQGRVGLSTAIDEVDLCSRGGERLIEMANGERKAGLGKQGKEIVRRRPPREQFELTRGRRHKPLSPDRISGSAAFCLCEHEARLNAFLGEPRVFLQQVLDGHPMAEAVED